MQILMAINDNFIPNSSDFDRLIKWIKNDYSRV